MPDHEIASGLTPVPVPTGPVTVQRTAPSARPKGVQAPWTGRAAQLRDEQHAKEAAQKQEPRPTEKRIRGSVTG